MSSVNGKVLQGKRLLLVGGGGGGVGYAVSRAAGAAGADIAIVDLRGDAAEQAAKDVMSSGGSVAVPIQGDVTNGESVEHFVAEANRRLGGIDGVVTSLGGLMAFQIPFVRMHEYTDEIWDKVFDLNIRYVFRVLRPVVKIMLAQGRGGAIVTVGSDGGTAGHGAPLNSAYGAAKSGLAHLTKTLAVEYGSDGIRVNMVSPGPTATSSVASIDPQVLAGLKSMIPLGKQGESEDVANAVVFLLSSLAKHVSGQILGVDGGLSVQRPGPPLDVYGKEQRTATPH
jgi:3-oxoacyl-[acyl-carrier protein] reductase